jgi:acyl carrier protein
VSFDVSVLEIFTALCSGARLVIPDSEAVLNPPELTALCGREQVTVADIPPAFLELLAPEAFGELRIQFIGCEAFGGALATRWQRPGRRLINGYGPTEATVMMTLMELDEPYVRMPPIGRPMPNHRAYVVDRSLRPVPVGAAGELLIAGTGLARGYVNRPGLTAERFVPDPFGEEPGQRLYRTGDLARFRADGILEFLGRIDQQVKIRGYRIEIGEIESVLGSHPGVQQVAVVVRDRPGEAKHLVAYVQSGAGAGPPPADAVGTVTELRDWLGRRLPGYMVPQAIVPVERLPLLPSGKVDRAALPEPADVPATPGPARPPRNELERVLADGVFADVLGVATVDVEANFFQLGGTSLQLARLQARIAEQLDVEVPLRTLFDAPTVAGLAERLSGRVGSGALRPVRTAAPRPHRLPLSRQQQMLWLRAERTGWHHRPLAARLTGLVDVAAVSAAVHHVVTRHEMLRTTFQHDGGDPVQVVHDSLEPEVSAVDLTGAGIAGVHRVAAADVAAEFDLERGPLLRVTLARLDEFDHVLLVNAHPLVWDGWSRTVLARELLTLGDVLDDEPVLAPPPAQYADYVLWQREWLAGPEPADLVRHWRGRLAGVAPVPPLPGRAVGGGAGGRAGTHRVDLPAGLAAATIELGRQEGATPFATFLAAFTTALSTMGHTGDAVTGVPLANRVRPGTAGVIGQFVNMLPVRTDLSGDPSFRELLGRNRRAVADAFEHQELPPDLLTVALHGAGARRPLYRCTFDLLEQPTEVRPASGVEITPVQVDASVTDVDLAMVMERRVDGLYAGLRYAVGAYPVGTIERLADRFVAVLQAAADEPDIRLGALCAAPLRE